MARSAQEERIINQPIAEIIGKMRTIGSEKNFALRSENPSPQGVWFRVHHGVSMTSYGEKVTVTLTDMGAQTKVNIHSECAMPTQLFDMGKNAKVVKYIFDFIERPSAAPSAAPQPVPQAAPQPVPLASAPKFCAQCGAPLSAGSKFCAKCGAKIM